MTDAFPSLADLRREIDAIDDSLHDLLIRRGDVQAGVGRAKTGSQVYIRPGREAMVLRRLLARHRGAFPKPALVRIWREIFAAGLSLQNAFSLAVFDDAKRGETLRHLARDHFGSQTSMVNMGTAARVLEAVSEGHATVGILPMPESEEKRPWWPFLAREGEGAPRIIARLPFARSDANGNLGEALAIGLAPAEDTGHDRSYLATEVGEGTSRSGLRRALEKAGFEITDWKYWSGGGGSALYLVECAGIVMPEDSRLASLNASEDASVTTAWCLGSYAVPLDSHELG